MLHTINHELKNKQIAQSVHSQQHVLHIELFESFEIKYQSKFFQFFEVVIILIRPQDVIRQSDRRITVQS